MDGWPDDWSLDAIRLIEEGREREAALVKALEEIAYIDCARCDVPAALVDDDTCLCPAHRASRALAAHRREEPR